MGIARSQNPDTPEGLESWLFVRIHRVLAELPHSTELELGKLYQTRMYSSRASSLEILRRLPMSQEVHQTSEPHLCLYSMEIEFGSPLGGPKPHFLRTLCWGEHSGIYRRSKTVLWPKIGCVRPTCQTGRPCNLAGWPSFLLALPLGIGYIEHRLC
jgi:hypothetical protein